MVERSRGGQAAAAAAAGRRPGVRLAVWPREGGREGGGGGGRAGTRGGRAGGGRAEGGGVAERGSLGRGRRRREEGRPERAACSPLPSPRAPSALLRARPRPRPRPQPGRPPPPSPARPRRRLGPFLSVVFPAALCWAGMRGQAFARAAAAAAPPPPAQTPSAGDRLGARGASGEPAAVPACSAHRRQSAAWGGGRRGRSRSSLSLPSCRLSPAPRGFLFWRGEKARDRGDYVRLFVSPRGSSQMAPAGTREVNEIIPSHPPSPCVITSIALTTPTPPPPGGRARIHKWHLGMTFPSGGCTYYAPLWACPSRKLATV
nr:translation initiation factor IF-2-like [Equus asinus]